MSILTQVRNGRIYQFEHDSKVEPTTRQIDLLKSLWKHGHIKPVADEFDISPRTVEHHFTMLKIKVRARTTIDLIKWGVRLGILSCLTFCLVAKPGKGHQPPSPPTAYTTNLNLVWSSSFTTNSSALVYELVYTNVNTLQTNAALTFKLDEEVTGLWSSNRYNFAVRCAYTNAPNIWSPFCPFITWSAGQSFTGSFPSTNTTSQ